MNKDSLVHVRIPAETREAIERAARDDLRTMSSLIEKWLTDRLIEEGYLKRKEG